MTGNTFFEVAPGSAGCQYEHKSFILLWVNLICWLIKDVHFSVHCRRRASVFGLYALDSNKVHGGKRKNSRLSLLEYVSKKTEC